MARPGGRSAATFRFVVSYPWGSNAIEGYQAAAERFGLRARIDPTTDGGDVTRLLTHPDAATLDRAVARSLALPERSDEDDWPDVDPLIESGVHWFMQDRKAWDAERDVGALEGLVWHRTIVDLADGSMRVTLRVPAPAGRERPAPDRG